MKYAKAHYRSVLADEHLQSILMLGNANFEPQLGPTGLHNKKEFSHFVLDTYYKKWFNYLYYSLNLVIQEKKVQKFVFFLIWKVSMGCLQFLCLAFKG